MDKKEKPKKEENNKKAKRIKDKHIRSKFDKKKKLKKRSIREILSEFLLKAGSHYSPEDINKRLIILSLIFCGVLSLVVITTGIIVRSFISQILWVLLSTWTVILAGIYLVLLLSVFVYFDYKIYKRTKEIEDVLPEFLQLASANISAGMTIDRALWFAIRPKFGVLAKEMEEVAKSTFAGSDLEEALKEFVNKYKSNSLKEAMNLLIEGMRAGSEIGYLLNQISENMQDLKLLRKEISSSVTTYVIFITAAAIIGAPILLALSEQLLVIVSSLTAGLGASSGASSSFFSLNLSGEGISFTDFRIFSLIMLAFSSFFSALIIGVIRKGSAKEGFKYVIPYLAISYLLFFLSRAAFEFVLGGLF